MMPRVLTFDVPGVEAICTSPHRLVCFEWGDERAPKTIICAHGLTRNARDFDFLAAALAAGGYRVLAPDMPGRGKSEWLKNPAAYSYATYVSDMQFMLASLKLTRVHWLGTSMGGIIGMMLANAMPGMLQSLTLNDIGTLVSSAGLSRILSYAGVKMQFENRAEAEATLRKICQPFAISSELHWQHLFTHSLVDMPDGTVRFAYDPAIVGTLPRQDDIKDIDLWGLWEAVKKLPVLLIRGAQSDILTRETAQAMQAQHPALTLYEVPNAGHAPALMSDIEIARIRQWLDKLN
jgi:pimeloyl-ACP methyl ester carboxylesterase